MRRTIAALWLCLVATSVHAEGGWIADEQTGCHVWNPFPVPDETITWAGGCRNGKANGKGILKWYKDNELILIIKGVAEDGQCYRNCAVRIESGKYVGELKDHSFNGMGTIVYNDGTKYSGEWKNGKMDGKGEIVYSTGGSYSGEFKNDNFHGMGTLFFADKREYSGEFKNGKFHGNGTMTYKNGDKYSGSWLKGKHHGRGIYAFKDGSSYEGLWENGKRIKIF